MKRQVSETAADFLYYYLLGVTLEDIEKLNDKEMSLICANRAYLDMNRTLKFSEPCEKKEEKEKRKCFCHTICDLIVKKVLNMLENSHTDQFDDWHSETCLQIINVARQFPGFNKENILDIIENSYSDKDKNERFYYGQAQKWLNMTIKYMWITGKWNEEIKSKMSVLHVPVDSYIIEGVWNRDGWEDVLKGILVNGKEKSGRFSSDKVVPWSKWDETQYKDFQVALRTKLKKEQTPFEWEEETWIEIAKLRANE